jgi:hypothetical protein
MSYGKPTWQSSTDKGGESSRAVDGNANPVYRGASCTHTKIELNAWWAVDTGELNDIKMVKITNRQDCCSK